MNHSDLADYLDNDPFLEYPLHGSGVPSPPAGRVLEPSEPQQKATAKPGVSPGAKLSTPMAPDKSKRSSETEQEKFKSDVLRMVMDVFPGARWTTREEYRRLAENRDRRGRKKRA